MDEVEYIPVICIGGGISGICLGVQLQRQLGFTDFRIYEQMHEFGGTWLVNTYPGCACDIPAILYSFSFAQNPEWTAAFPPQPEILKYLISVADAHGLRARTTFRTKCVGATWDEGRKRWRVRLSHVDSDSPGAGEPASETFEKECRVLISAVGILTQPHPASLTADFSAFKGPVFHSGRWDHSVDLRDKDVVVIGNGCSANQVVPTIAPSARSVTQISRSAHWILEPGAIAPPWTGQNELFKKIPLLQRAVRLLLVTFFEISFVVFFKTAVGRWGRNKLAAQSREYVQSTAPAEYHDILIPKYEIGCKRRIFDSSGYLKSLHLKHLRLVRSSIREVLPHAILTDAGTHPAEVIILATGYSSHASYVPFQLIGRDRESIHRHWAAIGGPCAFESTACAGFPNFFMILGPNSLTGHTSTIVAVENTVNLVIKLLRPILSGREATVEVNRQREASYLKIVQNELRKTILTGCRNWYSRDDGWNTAVYPWSQVVFWWRCTFPRWQAWMYSK